MIKKIFENWISSKELETVKSFVYNLQSDNNETPKICFNEKQYQEFKKILWRNSNKDFYICYMNKIEFDQEFGDPNDYEQSDQDINEMFPGCFELYTSNEFQKVWPKINDLLKIKNNKIQIHSAFKRDKNYYNNDYYRESTRIINGIGNFLDENPNLIAINYSCLVCYRNF